MKTGIVFYREMGNLISNLMGSHVMGSGGSKRKVEDLESEDEDAADFDSLLHTPKRYSCIQIFKLILRMIGPFIVLKVDV